MLAGAGASVAGAVAGESVADSPQAARARAKIRGSRRFMDGWLLGKVAYLTTAGRQRFKPRRPGGPPRRLFQPWGWPAATASVDGVSAALCRPSM
ncbi:hypothetical protein GCM10011521_21750 [Arenimonas soli]|uniref:Uncharacterized protein n=1 Tax=Arenimonas soli TaxID=2269504 RepID=A0ABQ1HMG6_9GAMM|nr:hypothetical protein GCM10011521_21750 [Arenimonas soli]